MPGLGTKLTYAAHLRAQSASAKHSAELNVVAVCTMRALLPLLHQQEVEELLRSHAVLNCDIGRRMG